MIQFILKRILSGIFILFSVITVVFFLFKFSFPNPEKMAIGQRTDVATQESIKKEFGLDKPTFTQYALFLNDISPISLHSKDEELNFKYDPLLKIILHNKVILIKTPKIIAKRIDARAKMKVPLKDSLINLVVLTLD